MLFLLIFQLYSCINFKFVCLVNYIVVGVVSLMAGLTTPPVNRWLLGIADIKPQRRRLTTRQLAQRLVTTPRPPKYYTTKILKCYTKTFAGEVFYPLPRSIALPRVTTPARHRRMLTRTTTPRLPSATLFPVNQPRLRLITPPKRWNTTPKCQITALPDLHNHDWDCQGLRSPDLLHRRCSWILSCF